VNRAEFDALRAVAHTRSGDISYVDAGTGPVALFVHGLGTGAYLWRNLVEELRGERRCIAFDLPLHGHSPATDAHDFTLPGLARVIEDLCAALGLDQVDLVANDTGGAVAQVFAAAHPERLRTFTLSNCETHDNLPNEAFQGTVDLAKRGQLAPAAVEMVKDIGGTRTGGRSVTLNYERPDDVSDETVRAYLEPIGGSLETARQFERLVTSLHAADLLAAEDGLARLTAPTLIVWGTGDFHFEVEWAYRLRDLIPGATEVVELDGAKLFFPDERAGEFAGHLRRHWQAHPAGVPA